jgi:hypothetical protein
MIGLLKLSRLFESPLHHRLLVQDYGVDDRWFQKIMADVDVLRPKLVAAMVHQRSRFRHVWQRLSVWLSRAHG